MEQLLKELLDIVAKKDLKELKSFVKKNPEIVDTVSDEPYVHACKTADLQVIEELHALGFDDPLGFKRRAFSETAFGPTAPPGALPPQMTEAGRLLAAAVAEEKFDIANWVLSTCYPVDCSIESSLPLRAAKSDAGKKYALAHGASQTPWSKRTGPQVLGLLDLVLQETGLQIRPDTVYTDPRATFLRAAVFGHVNELRYLFLRHPEELMPLLQTAQFAASSAGQYAAENEIPDLVKYAVSQRMVKKRKL